MPQEYNPDWDKNLVPIFKNHLTYNHSASRTAGRPIYDDCEIVEVHVAGRKDYPGFPAFAQSHWTRDEHGGLRIVTYAERWSKQYEQFKAKQTQTKTGTPINQLPFLTPARCAELNALKIYTAEALASLDGQELKNLGMHGRALKDQAVAWIEAAKMNTVPGEVRAELEALRAQNALLSSDVEILRQKMEQAAAIEQDKLDSTFDGMSEDDLKAFIKAKCGVEPRGNPNRRTLVRLAEEQSKAASL